MRKLGLVFFGLVSFRVGLFSLCQTFVCIYVLV